MKLLWVDHPKISLSVSLTFDVDKVTMNTQIVSYTISPILISMSKEKVQNNQSLGVIVDPVLADFFNFTVFSVNLSYILRAHFSYL